MAQFHPHWYLTTPESLPPIDPRLLVLEPHKNCTRGRPEGAKNKPTSQEELESSTQDTSTHRIASRRGRGRLRGTGRTQETTRRQIIPDNGQPQAQPLVTSTQAPGVNQRTSVRGRARGRGGGGTGGRGRTGGTGGSTCRTDGIPDTMLNEFQF
jgi:hypothetical protein